MKLATLTLVGPGEVELERLGRMLRSLSPFSTHIQEVVLIDDSLISRELEKHYVVPTDVRLTSLVNERRGRGPGIFGGACTGLLQGLRHLSTRTDLDAVLKIDTDALAINHFAEKFERLLQNHPEAGTAGSVEQNCDGSPRDWEPFGSITERLTERFMWKRHKLLRRRVTLFGYRATLRRLVQRARRLGYRWGEHAQGGSYLISGLLVQRMKEAGYLEHGNAWLDIFMCEDPMMGLYARACGLRNVAFNAVGEAFGVGHIGLPLRPQELIDRGYSIVHSMKNNPESEADLFELFCGNTRDGRNAGPPFLPR